MHVGSICLVVFLIGIAAAVGGAVASSRRRRRRGVEAALTAFERRATDGGLALKALCSDPSTAAPAWFLTGVLALRQHSLREATRAFGMAHHADHHWVGAALLTFAALKARETGESNLLDHIVQTWKEMGQPDAAGSPVVSRMLDAIGEPPPDTIGLTPLGRFAWSVVGDRLREELAVAGAGQRWPELVQPARTRDA